jgi:6-pyruvoyltetrahydropterin/6-carboxytetrahydropterin synthase
MRSAQGTLQTTTIIRADFSAAHYYRVGGWSEDENLAVFGKCARPQGHGHNYEVEVAVRLKGDTSRDAVIAAIHRVLSLLDHKNLNLDTDYFREFQPTTENLCALLFSLMRNDVGESADLVNVRLFEAEDLWAVSDGSPVVRLGRRVTFSASHRLWSPLLSAEQNEAIFGKCANANGHGHNYALEIEVAGIPSPETGFVAPLETLDGALKSLVAEWDHNRLDTDAADFQLLNPTGEHIAMVAFQRLKAALNPLRLAYVRLWETRNIFFEVIPE